MLNDKLNDRAKKAFSVIWFCCQITWLHNSFIIYLIWKNQLDVLWKVLLLLQSPRPAWSGMMQMLHDGPHPGKSSIEFLPVIDLDPCDPTCIYSTLKFVVSQARLYDVTPVLTFDQPLYWKALSPLTVIRSQPNDTELNQIVLRLWGFHMQMNFLSSMGHLMAYSGLQELLEVVYAGNTVTHMMTGKAVYRAIHGHLLVDAAWSSTLLADVYNVPVPTKDVVEAQTCDGETNKKETIDTVITDVTEARELYMKTMSSSLPVLVEDVCSAEVLQQIKSKRNNKKKSMTHFWLQYQDMIDILKKFMKAEWTGHWNLHPLAVFDMLPYHSAHGYRPFPYRQTTRS